MTRNEGNVDRVVRVAFGIALLCLVVIGPRTWLGLLGFIPLVTGLAGYCPLYRLLGVNTCGAKP